MIGLIAVLFAASPEYAVLDPFMDEPKAARAFEQHIQCLGQAAFMRQNDAREPKVVAAEVVQECTKEAIGLQAALADVYRREPSLIGAAGDPKEAADEFVRGAQNRVEIAIAEYRARKKH